MADMIKMQIENAQAVQNALNAFEKKVAKKVVRQGVRAAWKPLLDRAKANAKANVGGEMGNLLAKHMTLRAFRRQKKGQYGMLVRIKPGIDKFVQYSMGSAFSITGKRKQISGSRYYIPSAIEYGHAFPGRGGKGAPKDVAAMPFMRPALDVTLPGAPKIFERYLVHAIHEENAKR